MGIPKMSVCGTGGLEPITKKGKLQLLIVQSSKIGTFEKKINDNYNTYISITKDINKFKEIFRSKKQSSSIHIYL